MVAHGTCFFFFILFVFDGVLTSDKDLKTGNIKILVALLLSD